MRLPYLGLLFLFLAVPAGKPVRADCTLAGTAVCDGAACPGKTFKPGQIIYNADHGVLQTCLPDNTWIGLHKAVPSADPCAGNPAIGATCGDGTVYAGLFGGNKLYVPPTDQIPGTWKTSTGMIDIPASSNTDGKFNSDHIPNSTTFPAFKACKDLTFGGYNDWYLPALGELQIVYNNLVNGQLPGAHGFSPTGSGDQYWTSSEFSGNAAYAILFFSPIPVGIGTPAGVNKINWGHARCVRR